MNDKIYEKVVNEINDYLEEFFSYNSKLLVKCNDNNYEQLLIKHLISILHHKA